MYNQSPYFLVIFLLVALASKGQNLDLTGINSSLEIYQYYPLEFDISSGMRLNGALAGGENQSRITAMATRVSNTEGVFVDSYLSYDAFVKRLKGGVGISLAYRGHMQEPTIRFVYSPKFTSSSGHLTIAPFIGINVTDAKFSLDRYVSQLSLGGIVNSSQNLAGFDLKILSGRGLRLNSLIGQAYSFRKQVKGSILLQLSMGYEQYHSYLEKGERWALIQNDTIHSSQQSQIMLVNRIRLGIFVLGAGLSYEWNVFETGEIRSEFHRHTQLRPIAQLGIKTKEVNMLLGLRGFTITYRWGK
ncbi:MAG: hypothetical protein AAF587_02785 [Bacteroidota bacterium]